MLIISVIKKDLPNTDLFAITRVVWLIPGIICASFLIQMGEEITFETITTTSEYELANPSTGTIQVLNSTTTESTVIPLFNPVFITFHYLITIVLVFYVITQVLTLLTAPSRMKG